MGSCLALPMFFATRSFHLRRSPLYWRLSWEYSFQSFLRTFLLICFTLILKVLLCVRCWRCQPIAIGVPVCLYHHSKYFSGLGRVSWKAGEGNLVYCIRKMLYASLAFRYQLPFNFCSSFWSVCSSILNGDKDSNTVCSSIWSLTTTAVWSLIKQIVAIFLIFSTLFRDRYGVIIFVIRITILPSMVVRQITVFLSTVSLLLFA